MESKLKGFSARAVFVDGDVGVAAGAKSPGTELPMAAGFDPKKNTALWTKQIADRDDISPRALEHADLRFGLFAASYMESDEIWRLALLDAKSGDKKWDVKLDSGVVGGGEPDGVTLSQRYVYAAHGYGVEVYRISNGKRVGRIGEF
jgi:hypothetical protein